MSTNFYARSTGTDLLHIGKRSGGWEFLFRAHPSFGLTSSKAWYDLLSCRNVNIYDESGTLISLEEFWPQATRRLGEVGESGWAPLWSGMFGDQFRDRQWRDESGYPFADYEFS